MILVFNYNDVIMTAMASQITSLTIVYSIVYSRHRSKKTSKLRVTGLCKGNSPVTRKMFPFHDVIMQCHNTRRIGTRCKARGKKAFRLKPLAPERDRRFALCVIFSYKECHIYWRSYIRKNLYIWNLLKQLMQSYCLLSRFIHEN